MPFPTSTPRPASKSPSSKSTRSTRSPSVTSSSSGSSFSSSSSYMFATKYVRGPAHNQARSDRSSSSVTSSNSSRPTSPRSCGSRSISPVSVEPTTPGRYSFNALLSLRPLADEGMKQRMRDGSCPEVVMNRRMRKGLQYATSQLHTYLHAQPRSPSHPQPQPQPEPQPEHHLTLVTPSSESHNEEDKATVEPTPLPTISAPSQQLALPRRNRPIRALIQLEIRRVAMQEARTWKGMHPTVQPLSVL